MDSATLPPPPGSEGVPTLVEGVRDQILVRELLDHPDYWGRKAETGALASASSR